ncbi:MAG: hypothetical protein E7658_06025 [Ruminococcaceae bacterium]|nr:hypothetical protein [Oscillospiraceae bacterium]
MTYHRTPGQSGNQLAEKLRREYRNRGDAIRGISATSTEELVTRAQMGRNPRVNVSEKAFTESFERHSTARTASPRQEYAKRSCNTGNRAYSTGRRSAAGNSRQNVYGTEMFRDTVAERQEIQVEKKRFPLTFLLLLSFVTVMIMMIILSIAQIYQTTDAISDLEYQLTTLQTTAAELELKIEEKNDIRVIEQIATDRLGMVKEDSVQKKYISLSDGERIELVENTSDENAEGGLGAMLSSIWTAFGDFFAGNE